MSQNSLWHRHLACDLVQTTLTHDELGKYQFAIEDYNQAIALNPQDADAYNNRGYTYYLLKKYEEAMEDFNQAIALAPQYAKAYNNRGLTHKLRNRVSCQSFMINP